MSFECPCHGSLLRILVRLFGPLLTALAWLLHMPCGYGTMLWQLSCFVDHCRQGKLRFMNTIGDTFMCG